MFNSQEFKAGVVCVVAFTVGLLIASSGCSNRSRVIGIQSPIEFAGSTVR